MKTRKDFENAVYKHLQDQGLGKEKVSMSVLNNLIDFMYKTCLGELLPIDIFMQQSELLLQSYKEGFDAATESIIQANKMVQKKKLQ
jgi:hypothetical protein